MQNSTPAQQPRPKLTIMYFTKIALEQLKGKIPVILLVLALLALPAALVNAYSAGNMLSSVSRLLERYDLSSPESAQAFLLALSDAQAVTGFADIALWFISQLLSCAVITAAAVFIYEAVNKDVPFDEVKARMPVTLLKRSVWVLIISIFVSFLMSMLGTYITYLALLCAAMIGGTPGIIISAAVFLLALWLTTAFINLFMINMRTAVAVNRARLLFSVTYVSTILRGRYKKSLPVYIAALGCRFLLTILLAAGAYCIIPLEGGSGYITLFVYFFLSLLIDGLFSAFYAINFFKLEITGQKQLIKLQAALMKKYEAALRKAGQLPPKKEPSDNNRSASVPRENPDAPPQPQEGVSQQDSQSDNPAQEEASQQDSQSAHGAQEDASRQNPPSETPAQEENAPSGSPEGSDAECSDDKSPQGKKEE